jgi:hypothetical protein
MDTKRKRSGMSGDVDPKQGFDTGIIPLAAKRALHNLPKSEDSLELVIDLIEYPELDHVGVRCYGDQVASVPVMTRMRLFERMVMMQKVLQTWNVSVSLEKVPGKPPSYVR